MQRRMRHVRTLQLNLFISTFCCLSIVSFSSTPALSSAASLFRSIFFSPVKYGCVQDDCNAAETTATVLQMRQEGGWPVMQACIKVLKSLCAFMIWVGLAGRRPVRQILRRCRGEKPIPLVSAGVQRDRDKTKKWEETQNIEEGRKKLEEGFSPLMFTERVIHDINGTCTNIFFPYTNHHTSRGMSAVFSAVSHWPKCFSVSV